MMACGFYDNSNTLFEEANLWKLETLSIHSGASTSNYTFIWGMVGENQTFTDMDAVPMGDLKQKER